MLNARRAADFSTLQACIAMGISRWEICQMNTAVGFRLGEFHSEHTKNRSTSQFFIDR
jgi:hypothetical protein